jgi:hypothetical protein
MRETVIDFFNSIGRLSSDERARCGPAYQAADALGGEFCVLQICYSSGSNPYLTGLAPVIPPPELKDGNL